MTSGSSPFAISHLTTEVWVNRVNHIKGHGPYHVKGMCKANPKPLNPKPLTGAKKLLFVMPTGLQCQVFSLSLSNQVLKRE
jgi:hypothetical protein